eukprot:m.243025 g.243025  ORF g.243025 m.243025 type:complete len:75 (+) comp17457_c1_seq8:2810-3034(+)
MAVPLIQAIRHQVGWLISDFNGSIIESSGQLLNQASIAAQALSLLQDTQQVQISQCFVSKLGVVWKCKWFIGSV